jgi:hypothetical protein
MPGSGGLAIAVQGPSSSTASVRRSPDAVQERQASRAAGGHLYNKYDVAAKYVKGYSYTPNFLGGRPQLREVWLDR